MSVLNYSRCVIVVLKAYTNVTNIIVRLSCPEHEPRTCQDNAVLINSHFDTTLGSPGATDDGSGVAVMLEIIRVLSTRDWSGYKNAIVFCKCRSMCDYLSL